MAPIVTVQGILLQNGRRVIVVHRRTPVTAAVEKMRREGVGALVVSRDGREIQGLVSGRDIIRALVSNGVDQSLTMSVADIMSWPVDSCTPGDSLRSVLATMTRRRIRYMPVTENGGLCGIVSIGEVVGRRLREAETEARAARQVFRVDR